MSYPDIHNSKTSTASAMSKRMPSEADQGPTILYDSKQLHDALCILFAQSKFEQAEKNLTAKSERSEKYHKIIKAYLNKICSSYQMMLFVISRRR